MTAGLFFFFLALMAFGKWVERWSQTPILIASPQVVNLPAKASLRQFSHLLFTQDIINNELFFHIWVRWKGFYPHFQAGSYQFVDQVSPQDIASKVLSGEVYNPVSFEITIPEGYSLQQTIDKINSAGIGKGVVALTALAKKEEFLSQVHVNAPSLEGFLYPATYKFYKEKPSAEKIYQAMVEEFFKRLPNDYESKLHAQGLSLYQGVILASLIEKETFQPEERNFIAEVILNRLKVNMPLGIDAALIYGIKDYDGTIRFKDLQDASNPYNTRIHRGLPPTPIASPSLEALLAVVSPTNHGYFYYVLLPGDEKKHHFSSNLKEHNLYVHKLVDSLHQKKAANE